VRRLLPRLLHLLLKLRHLRFCLFQGNVLHQSGLGQNVKRVGIAAKLLIQKRFSVGVFFL
jgi:hypothetical protein